MCLIQLALFRHLVTDAVGVPESPNGQPVENAKLQEHIKLQEFIGNLVISKGVRDMGGLRVVLASRILIEVVEPKSNKDMASAVTHR